MDYKYCCDEIHSLDITDIDLVIGEGNKNPPETLFDCRPPKVFKMLKCSLEILLNILLDLFLFNIPVHVTRQGEESLIELVAAQVEIVLLLIG